MKLINFIKKKLKILVNYKNKINLKHNMFFPFYGLTNEQVTKCLKFIEDSKKEQKRKEELKKLYEGKPPTSLSGMIAYSAILKNLNSQK